MGGEDGYGGAAGEEDDAEAYGAPGEGDCVRVTV